MNKKIVTLTALAIGAAAIAGFTTPAQAGQNHKAGKIHHKHKHHKPHRHIQFHLQHGYNYYAAPCRYFLKNAHLTGKRYWWRKYHRCIARTYDAW